MPGAYDKRYEWISGMAHRKKDGGIYLKTRMKGIAKRIAVTAIAVAVVFGGIQTASVTAEAKGTAFINKKVSNVTPTVKSAKWSNGKVNVTVSIPANKVKKLGKVKKVTVAYGSTRNSKKFEAVKARAKVAKKGKNQYTFTINSKKLRSYKNAYLTVKFDGKTNWSKLAKVSGKAVKDDPRAKRDKDGTYTTAIYKRFNQGYEFNEKHYNEAYRGTIGVWSDNDGWIYIESPLSKCRKCGEIYHTFTDPRGERGWDHPCIAGTIGYIECIAFDEVTGKVVNGNPEALKDYPIGTFFMDVY